MLGGIKQPDAVTALQQAWLARGASSRAARVLALTGVAAVEEAAKLGPSAFYRFPNCGTGTVNEIRRLVGGWRAPPRTPLEAIAAALLLSVRTPSEALEMATDAVCGLTRQGYKIVAREVRP